MEQGNKPLLSDEEVELNKPLISDEEVELPTLKKKASSEATSFVPTLLKPPSEVSTSQSGSGDLASSKNKANLLLRKQYETEGKEFSSYKKMSFDEYKSFVKKYNPNADLDNYENVKSLFIKSNDGLPLMMNAYSEVEEFDKSISGSEKMNFSQTPSEILAKETPKEAPKPSINKNKFEPTIADVNKKITDITLKQKFPEYGEFKSFTEASKQAISEEQKQIQLDAENRSKERRLKTIPAELQELNKEKNELLLKKDYDSMKKLAAIDAVTKRYDKLLKENEPKSYADINNLNKDVIKGMEDEVHQYINLPGNKYIKEKIEKVGLTDIETNEILLKATEQKTKPIIADLKQLKDEGIVDIAKQKMEMSKSINSKQEELKTIGQEIDKIQESELDKKGFKELNVQINKERANLDKLKPSITAIESDAKLIAKEKGQIESEIAQYESKIKDNKFVGTEQEFKKYNELFSDYNVLVSKEKELYSTPELAEYNKQIGLLNSLQETKNGLVKGLEGTKYGELVAKYDLIRNDINNIITKYQETDSPEINQKLNQYFSLANQLDKATEKYEIARGGLVSLDELDRAKKEIENDPNYATDFGARALNSIADFGKGIAAFPFSFAASLHSDGGYHYSDAISDAIQGKGMEKGFLVNKNESLINPETGKANWGVIPVINSIGDNLGTLLGFALTGKYLTPIVAGEVSGASSTIMEAQKATEIAKAYTTIVPAYMSSYSGALDEAKELGFQGKGAFLYANAIGFLNGVSEMILPDQDLVFGKGVKTKMLKEFIENYAKNPATAVKDLTKEFVKNGLGEASEEWIVMLGETAASSLGHLADSDIKAKIPTIDEIATTGVSSAVIGSGMGLIGQYSENKTLNRLGKLEFAKDFENGKLILDGLKEKGTLTDDKYNKLISDIQKYQSVLGQVPDGISDLKKVAIIEKMLEIKAIKANQPKEKSEVFEKIANKKINEIQSQIETIIDDKDFDKNEEKKFRLEMEEMVRMFNESVKSKPKKETQLQKFTSPTEDNYGTINRNDGKGIVTLTKEEYLNELQGKITTLESSIDAIDNEQSKAVVYEQVNELNKEKAEILKREIKPQNEIRNTDNDIRPQVESPQQEINLTPIEVIAGKEQGNVGGSVAKVVQSVGQNELDTKNAKPIEEVALTDINKGDVIIGYHSTPSGDIDTGNELGIHIGTEDVADNINKGKRDGKGVVKKVAFKPNKPLILGDMPSWSSINVLGELLRQKFTGIDRGKLEEIRDSDLTEKEKQKQIIDLIKGQGFDAVVYQNFDEGNGEYSYILFDKTQLNELEAKATSQTKEETAPLKETPTASDVESTAKALEDKKSSLDEKAKKLGYIGIKQFNAQNQLNENLTDAEKTLLQEYSDFQQEIKNLKDEDVIAKLSDDEFSSWSKANDITRDDLGKVVKDEEIELAAKRIRILNARGDSKKSESELKKLKESKKKDNWTIESWKERFDEDIEQSEIDDINSSNKEFNKSVDKAVESLLSNSSSEISLNSFLKNGLLRGISLSASSLEKVGSEGS